MISRFLAIDDPDVALVMSRDLDARFSPREVMAVNEWLGHAGAPLFHSMRDHKFHNRPIMGGMFGMDRGLVAGAGGTADQTVDSDASGSAIPPPLAPSMSYHAWAFLKANVTSKQMKKARGTDQVFLEEIIWPRVKHTALSHDSRLNVCRRYASQWCHEYPLGPVSTTTHYIGMGAKNTGNWSYDCTMECEVVPFRGDSDIT